MILHQFPAYGNIGRVPTVEMDPDSLANHFVVEMLYESSLEPVSMCKLGIKQMVIIDSTRALVEQLRLLTIK